MTRPVNVDHLQRCSQIFRSDRTEMVRSICWFLRKISEIFGWTERGPGLNTSFALSLGILTTNVASNCSFSNLRKGYLSNLNFFQSQGLGIRPQKCRTYSCTPLSPPPPPLSAKHWCQHNFQKKQSALEGGHNFVGREKLFYQEGFQSFSFVMDYKVKNQNGRKPNSKVHRHIYISTSFPHERLSKLPEPSRGEGQLCKFLIPRNASKSESASKNVTTQRYYPVADPGERPGGPVPLLIFRPSWDPKDHRIFVFETAPSFLRV